MKITKESIMKLGFKPALLRRNAFYMKVSDYTLLYIDINGERHTVYAEDIEDDSTMIFPNCNTIDQLKSLIEVF